MPRDKWGRGIKHAMALTALVWGIAGCAVESGAPDAEEVGSQRQTLDARTRVDSAYWYVFGRGARESELLYWGSGTSTDDLIRWHKAYFQSNQAERRATINRAYMNVYHRGATNDELNSWDSYVVGRDYVHITLCGKLEEYARNNHFSANDTYFAWNWSATAEHASNGWQTDGYSIYTGATYAVPFGPF